VPVSTVIENGSEAEPKMVTTLAGLQTRSTAAEALGSLASVPFEPQTIKEMILKALRDGFPLGADAQLIRDFIRDAYGQDIQADTFRSQLARLKAQGHIEHSHGWWQLTQAGTSDNAPIDRGLRRLCSQIIREMRERPSDEPSLAAIRAALKS